MNEKIFVINEYILSENEVYDEVKENYTEEM